MRPFFTPSTSTDGHPSARGARCRHSGGDRARRLRRPGRCDQAEPGRRHRQRPRVHGQPGPVHREPDPHRQEGLGRRGAEARMRAAAEEPRRFRNLVGKWVNVSPPPVRRRSAPRTRSATPGTPTSSSRSWATSGSTRHRSTCSRSASGALPGIVKQSFTVKIDQYGGDSYQTDKPYRIRLGKGGVDDAEDGEVIVHEYGHAVHASQVPGYGASLDAGSIGESFGDYLSVTVGLAAAKQYGWPVSADQACPRTGTRSPTPTRPHCLRRFDADLTSPTATRCTTTARSGAGRSGTSAGYVGLGKTTAGGTPRYRQPVQLCAGHLLLGRRGQGDLPQGAEPGRSRPPRTW